MSSWPGDGTVTRYAIIQGGQVVNIVLWDGDTTKWQPPQGATCVPFDPATHVMVVDPAVANTQTIDQRVDANIATLQAWVAAHPSGATLTAAQTLTVANMLIGLGKLVRGALTDTTGT